jgi:DNA polymerase-3 subunit gamma/tau
MSQYIVSARKYRPRRFDEVVGQEHVSRTLKNALRTDHLAHAFLFCGPRGVGKTTCARILARTINCQNLGKDFEACGECSSCKSFEDNASFNIIELDAASHNSVEHIRSLNEQVRIQPQQGDYKVFIIDEVHMLSQAAFNAFLKTLEEPPSYAVFILATTEKHKIIPTILSRCQIFDFKRISVSDIAAHLATIAEKEQINADREALLTIAQKSDGALRDALSLFDRLVSVAGEKLTYEDVVKNLSILDYEVFFNIVDACAREDISQCFLIFDSVLRNGFEAQSFLSGLAVHYRDLLVARDPVTLPLLDHEDSILEKYKQQAELLSQAQMITALHLLNECEIHFNRAQNKRLHVEMLLAKLCYAGRLRAGKLVGTEPATVEKKTQPANSNRGNALEESEPAIEQEKSKASAKPEEQEEKPITPAQESTHTKEQQKVTHSRGLKAIPKIKGINDLHSSIQQKEQHARENSLVFNDENILNLWNAYADSLDSPSVAITLKEAKITLEESRLRIRVGTQLARSRILEENKLLDQLREKFHNPRLSLAIDVDPSLAPEDQNNGPKKILTNKEKYEMLCAKNPLLQDLRKKLDLVVDHDDN